MGAVKIDPIWNSCKSIVRLYIKKLVFPLKFVSHHVYSIFYELHFHFVLSHVHLRLLIQTAVDIVKTRNLRLLFSCHNKHSRDPNSYTQIVHLKLQRCYFHVHFKFRDCDAPEFPRKCAPSELAIEHAPGISLQKKHLRILHTPFKSLFIILCTSSFLYKCAKSLKYCN